MMAQHDQRENGRQRMLSAMPTARIGNSGKKGKKIPGGSGLPCGASMLKILVVDGFHTDRTFPICLRLNLSRAVPSPPLLP